jgi:hypothetical protein
MSEKIVRVRFLQSVASEAWSYRPGQVADVEHRNALNFIRSGAAEPATGAEVSNPMGDKPAVCRYCGFDVLQYDGATGTWRCSACRRS